MSAFVVWLDPGSTPLDPGDEKRDPVPGAGTPGGAEKPQSLISNSPRSTSSGHRAR